MMVANSKYKSRVAQARQFIKDGLPELSEQANEARAEKLQQLCHAVLQQKYAGKIGENGFINPNICIFLIVMVCVISCCR
ncbi:MAG: hypothetical protein LBU34_12630 [Planctomycetaceae bacterium]|jgi:hypothetical protein|nr:hypothetical protein [Planctomycetaceae bacterium]